MNNVDFQAGGVQILSEISLELDSNRVAIIGLNGSGKSTFARLLNGLVIPDKGSVSVFGLNTKKDLKQVRQQVGFVFQNPDLQFVFPTVEEDLQFGLKNIGLPATEQSERIEEVLERYSLGALRHRTVHSLSGGEKQLVCIAAVEVMRPKLIVFDEPTTLLDLKNKQVVNSVILGLSNNVVTVTHDLEFASLFEQVVLMDEGRVKTCGSPKETILQYKELVTHQA